MSKKIKELYQKLYNQNIDILEEKRNDAQKEKTINNTSVATSVISRIILRIVLLILAVILIDLFARFMINDMALNYKPGQMPKSMSMVLSIIIPAMMVITLIVAIYQMLIRPKRSIHKNYKIKNSTTNAKEYNDVFCEKICKPIIEEVFLDTQYEHSNGISRELYESMGFSNNQDTFTSSDNISLKNNSNLQISKVHTKFKESNGNGYWYSTLFCGLVSINSIPFNLPFYIKIRNKKLGSLKLKNAIKIYNDEFNKYYEIETDNISLLNKYFNNKIFDYFIELAKKNQNLEMNISQNNVYIRLHNKDFLDFSINSEYNEEKIIDSCNSIITLINTNDFILDELKLTNI